MLLFNLLLLVLSLASAVVARSSPRRSSWPQKLRIRWGGGCSLDNVAADLPQGAASLAPPSGQKLIYLAIGVGTQNYTCDTSSGKYLAAGAVAKLYDAACKANNASSVHRLVREAQVTAAQAGVKAAQSQLGLTYLGAHYFQKEGYNISPVFDFRTGALSKDPNGFVIVKKTGDVPAATALGKNPSVPSVDWLQLQVDSSVNGAGDLASTVLRTWTAGGYAPSGSCKSGDSAKVAYAAEYAFYK